MKIILLLWGIKIITTMRTQKQIIKTIDKLSQYLFLGCLIGMPIFLIYNLLKL